MITHFQEKQIDFSEAIESIASEITDAPKARAVFSPLTLAIVDSLIEFRVSSSAMRRDALAPGGSSRASAPQLPARA